MSLHTVEVSPSRHADTHDVLVIVEDAVLRELIAAHRVTRATWCCRWRGRKTPAD